VDVLACRDPPLELLAPRGEAVDPAGDAVAIGPEAVDRERPGEAVVSERPHARLAPAPLALVPVPDDGRDDVVAVGEDVGTHLDGVADDPLHREAAAVDLRRQAFDDDAAAPVPEVGSRLAGHGSGRPPLGCLGIRGVAEQGTAGRRPGHSRGWRRKRLTPPDRGSLIRVTDAS
jgi:hypothetical protein